VWQTTGVGLSWAPRAVVVGSGLGGLECALELAAAGWGVEVVSAGRPGHDGATHRVHALAPWVLLTAPWVRGDGPDRFLADLKRRGQGMEREGLAEVLAAEAHQTARRLIETMNLETLEPEPAILPGDDIPRGMRCVPRNRHVLLAPHLAGCARRGVRLRGRALAVGLLTAGGRTTGVVVIDRNRNELVHLHADAVVLACGGPGAVFPVATQPRWCRGSGLALASAGAVLLHHPELTQALPVTATRPLYFPTSAAVLAGRIQVNGRTLDPVPALETATLEIADALRRGATVFLNPVAEGKALLPARVRESASFKAEGRVPLTVALHHGVGGIAVDTWGRTSLPGLYACGEAAGGVQGRQRTMGTGLLEAAIFARRAARAACRDAVRAGPTPAVGEPLMLPTPADPAALEGLLDALMGPLVVLRPKAAVATALTKLENWPARGGDGADEKCALAGLRRQAALALLAGEQGNGPSERDS
jgi:aspartate oxidase